MKTAIEFKRKAPSVNVDEADIIAYVELPQNQYEYFKTHLFEDYGFIDAYRNEQYVDSNGVTHCIAVCGEESDDGVLVNSEGTSYARYSAFYPNLKPFIMKNVHDVAQDILKEKFGQNENGSWVIGFDDIKEHFDMTVTPNNGIGTLLLEELERSEEVGEIIATEDCIEITEYLENVPEDATLGERLGGVVSLMGCNVDDGTQDDDIDEGDGEGEGFDFGSITM